MPKSAAMKKKQMALVEKWMAAHKDDKRAKPDKLADAWAYARNKTGQSRTAGSYLTKKNYRKSALDEAGDIGPKKPTYTLE